MTVADEHGAPPEDAAARRPALDGFDARGWAIGQVVTWPRERAISLLIPNARASFQTLALRGHAARVLACELELLPEKTFPTGAIPRADIAFMKLGAPFDSRWVETRLVPLERASSLLHAATDATRAMGDRGFSALVQRARAVMQISIAGEEADGAALGLAAVLASVFLGPILPPREACLFGVKGARERLLALGLGGAPR